MSHSITCKLNKDARSHVGQNGTTFFVSLGEKNYNFKTKTNEWTNYEAALFAKDAQIQFYQDALVKDAIIEVSGTGLIIEPPSDPQYPPRLQIQDAKLGFVHSGQSSNGQASTPQQSYQQAPQQPYQQQPQQQQAYQQPQQQMQQQPQRNMAPTMAQQQQMQQQAPQGFGQDAYDDKGIPF